METRFVIHRECCAGSVEARVIALDSNDTVRVIVGVGSGQLDGGVHQTWPLADLPPDLRLPNTVFWVTLSG